MIRFFLSLLLPLLLLWSPVCVQAQLQVVPSVGQSPEDLVKNVLIGQGVTVSNVKFNNSANNINVNAIGTFSNGNTTNIGLSGGLLLTSGSAMIAIGPNNSASAGQNNGLPGDPQLQLLIPGYSVNDASVLTFDFVPESDTVEFRWVFGSEEYPEFVNTSFNDVFGFFISGIDPATWTQYNNKNIALIPSPPAPANTPVTIDNVNHNVYSQFYVNNAGGATIQYDGFTTVLTAKAAVIPCLTYSIKIAVADAGDFIYDSGVFLEENSFNSGGITVTQSVVSNSTSGNSFSEVIEGCSQAKIVFRFPEPVVDSLVINIASIGGTAINGVDYTWIPNTVVFPAGSDSAFILIDPIADGITEGTETVILIVPRGICSFMTGEYDTHYVDIIDYTPLLAFTSNDTAIDCGAAINLTASASGGIGPYLYSWTNGGVSVGNSDTVNLAPLASATFMVEVTDDCGSTIYDSVEVFVDDIIVDAGNDTAICIGESISLTATGAAFYQWSNGGMSPTITVSPTVSTTYYVTGTDACSGTDSVTVTVHPLPGVSITPSLSAICLGENTGLLASGAETYLWAASPADPSLSGQETQDSIVVSPSGNTTYSVTGTDIHGCQQSNDRLINVKPSPTSDFLILDTLICENEPTTTLFTGTASSNAVFDWDFDGAIANGNGQGPYQLEWDNAGTYQVRLIVTDQGCPSLESIRNVSVQPHPVVGFRADVLSGCPPLRVQFTDTSSRVSTNASYYWTFGNGGEAYQASPSFNYTQSGTYTVSLQITNSNGCQKSLSKPAYIKAHPVPEAAFTHHPPYGSEFEPLIKFYDRSIGNVIQWYWETGDGQTYSDPDFHHQYADTGRYMVSLIVQNEFACTDTLAYEVWIRPDYTFYVPTAFTPDGDFLNDVFRVYGLNTHDFQLRIFDRWGGIVFESDDMERGWDGNINGKAAPVGSYVVVIYYSDVNGLKRSHYGNVMLLR